MGGGVQGTEIEIKLAVADGTAARRQARRIGAKLAGRVFEQNVLFDAPRGGGRGALRKRGELLRLRVSAAVGAARGAAPAVLLTRKGPSPRRRGVARYKERAEQECPVGDARLVQRILSAAGLRATFRYQKVRTTFRFPARARWARDLQLQLDETPAGDFWELEGPRRAIDRAARLLGYTRKDYLTVSYMGVWAQWLRRRGQAGGDMVFAARKSR